MSGRHERRDLREQMTSLAVSQFAEATPLVGLGTQAPSAEPGLQNAILFSPKRDQICLLTMKPRTYGHDEPLKRSHVRSLGDRVDPTVGHYALIASLAQTRLGGLHHHYRLEPIAAWVSAEYK